MGTTDITQPKSNGDVIDQTWYNDFRSTVIGNFLPRDPATGVLGSEPDLGSAIYPWGNIYGSGLVINGIQINLSTLVGAENSIISGQTRSNSIFPDFIRANGAAPSFEIQAATTNLVLNINSISTIVNTDIIVGALTPAPGANNTCLVNDPFLIGTQSSKFLGEDQSIINIDNAGSEITNRIGQYITLQNGSEYMYAYVESATQLTNVFRGYYFDNTGTPIQRNTLADNDVLTLMSTGWVFIENDGFTVDVTYRSPIYSTIEPSSPQIGDYWFDMVNKVWKRYNGSDFIIINRVLVGIVVVDTSNCVASRSLNFERLYNEFNPLELIYVDQDIIKINDYNFMYNVYGNVVSSNQTKISWDINNDLEPGEIEQPNTIYYAYLTEEGLPLLSSIKPYNQNGELKGHYHPYNSWRCVGSITNNGASNFNDKTIFAFDSKVKKLRIEIFDSSGIFVKHSYINNIRATCVGGGGGSAGVYGGNAGAGGNTELINYISATGGGGSSAQQTISGGRERSIGGIGGNGVNGDINLQGQTADTIDEDVIASPRGGNSILGFGGASKSNAGQVGQLYGGGASGVIYAAQANGTAGGGGGGAAISNLYITSDTAIIIGAGGSGTGGGSVFPGANGAAGVVIIEYIL